MFENNIFEEWLDKKSKEIILKLDQATLKPEEMMILVLKAQSNHFLHLDTDLRNDMIALREDINKQDTNLRNDMLALREDMNNDMRTLREDMNNRFEQVDKRFEHVDKRFERIYTFMKWQAGFALTFVVAIFGALGGIYLQLLNLHP